MQGGTDQLAFDQVLEAVADDSRRRAASAAVEAPDAESAAAFGEVFTRRWVVESILDLVEYTSDRDLTDLRLVEPSVGGGAFIGPIVDRLLESARSFDVKHRDLAESLRAFDVQPQHVTTSRLIAEIALRADGCDPGLASKLAETWIVERDFLLDWEDLAADFVVGNPPYIRIEDLDSQTAAEYRTRWTTMAGRADIYVGFYERSLRSLRDGGRLGFICADRWMRNQYGARLRNLVSDRFSVDAVWVMHDVDAFEESVSAYPAITILRAGRQEHAVVVATTAEFGSKAAAELVQWSRQRSNEVEFEGPAFTAHRLPHWFGGDSMWPAGSPRRLAMIEHLNETFDPLEDPSTGTKVGIGVATGADNAYLITDPTLVEPDRALPLAMGRDLRSGTFEWGGTYLANPWAADGSLVDLAEYPKLATHLSRHVEQLKDRHTARKQPRNWHRTIDRVNSDLIDRPLLLLRDMGSTINPVLEPGGWYPHHNLYWVSSEMWDLEVLGGLLLSRVAQAFVEAYGVRMRGGTLRFQSQYLRRIRVPDPEQITDAVGERLRKAFRSRDASAATNAAAAAYRIDLAEFDLA